MQQDRYQHGNARPFRGSKADSQMERPNGSAVYPEQQSKRFSQTGGYTRGLGGSMAKPTRSKNRNQASFDSFDDNQDADVDEYASAANKEQTGRTGAKFRIVRGEKVYVDENPELETSNFWGEKKPANSKQNQYGQARAQQRFPQSEAKHLQRNSLRPPNHGLEYSENDRYSSPQHKGRTNRAGTFTVSTNKQSSYFGGKLNAEERNLKAYQQELNYQSSSSGTLLTKQKKQIRNVSPMGQMSYLHPPAKFRRGQPAQDEQKAWSQGSARRYGKMGSAGVPDEREQARRRAGEGANGRLQDIESLQNDYEMNMQRVNKEAIERLKLVEEEHSRQVIHKRNQFMKRQTPTNRSTTGRRSQNLHDSFPEQDDEEPTYLYKHAKSRSSSRHERGKQHVARSILEVKEQQNRQREIHQKQLQLRQYKQRLQQEAELENEKMELRKMQEDEEQRAHMLLEKEDRLRRQEKAHTHRIQQIEYEKRELQEEKEKQIQIKMRQLEQEESLIERYEIEKRNRKQIQQQAEELRGSYVQVTPVSMRSDLVQGRGRASQLDERQGRDREYATGLNFQELGQQEQDEQILRRTRSRDTIQMLSESNDGEYQTETDGNYSVNEVQDNRPGKLREFYQQFQRVIARNTKARNGIQELDLLYTLLDLHLLCSTTQCRHQMEAKKALLTDVVNQQAYKFIVAPDQIVIKNLFKITCAILNIKLKQSGLNQLSNEYLYSFLDTINFNILDDDLVLMNQLAVIKNLASGTPFCIDDRQVGVINKKFINCYYQRLNHNGGVLLPAGERTASVEQVKVSARNGYQSSAYPRVQNVEEYYRGGGQERASAIVEHRSSQVQPQAQRSAHPRYPSDQFDNNDRTYDAKRQSAITEHRQRRGLDDSMIGRGSHYAPTVYTAATAPHHEEKKIEEELPQLEEPDYYDYGERDDEANRYGGQRQPAKAQRRGQRPEEHGLDKLQQFFNDHESLGCAPRQSRKQDPRIATGPRYGDGHSPTRATSPTRQRQGQDRRNDKGMDTLQYFFDSKPVNHEDQKRYSMRLNYND